MAGGQYGSYKYESPESRALASITSDSYDKDQAKNLIKLNNDVAYMAAYMRKMQKGIDEANQNVIQQIQSFINDFIVLLGGGSGGGGLDFGDLRYVIQMIGALLGFNVEGGVGGLLPLNAFNAIWHMLSTYIFPVEQFKDVIAAIVDTLIAQILDIFGDIPIIGEALQQLAVWLVDIRDGLFGIIDFVNDILNMLTGGLGGIGDIFTGIFNAFSFNLELDFSDPISFLTSLIDALFGPLVNFVEDLIGGIFSFTGFDLGGATSLFSDVFDTIQNIIDGIVGGIGNPVGAITGVITGIQGFIQDIVEGIIYAIRGIPFVGAGIADMIENLTGYREEVQTTQINQQNFQITTITAGYRNPAWVCRYPIADVTYPEFVHNNNDVSGTSGAASTGTAHTHSSGSYSTATSTFGAQPGSRSGTYLTITNSTIMDTMAVIMDKQLDSAIDNVYMEIFRESSDGSLTKIFSEDVSSLVTFSTSYVEIDIPALITQSGERYLLCIRNSSTTANNVNMLGMEKGGLSPNITFFTNGSSIPEDSDSYTPSEAETCRNNGNSIKWFMLAAKNFSQGDQSFSDDANRASIGPLWVPFSNTGANQIEIVNNEFNFSGSTVGLQGMLYARRTSSDSNRIEGDIHVITAGVGTHPHGGLLMHCDRELTQQVYLAVNDAGATIYTGVPGAYTPRATHATGGSGHWALYYDIVANTYYAEKDNLLTGLEWEDSGNLMLHNEDFRFGGLLINRAVVDFLNTHDACTIDNWTLRDFVAA